MAQNTIGKTLSHVLRQQLRDLRIDPDTVITPRRRRLRWLRGWHLSTSDKVLLGFAIGTLLVLITVIAVLSIVATAQPQSGTRMASPAGSTTVSSGDAVVQVRPPSYSRLSPGTAVVDLRLNLKNPNAVSAVLRAGDLLLVDGRGAQSPLYWQTSDRTWQDGLTEPDHALIGLGPGGEAAIDVSFLTATTGPFELRYRPTGRGSRGAQPTIVVELSEQQ